MRLHWRLPALNIHVYVCSLGTEANGTGESLHVKDYKY